MADRSGGGGGWGAYLFTALCVEQDPPKLNDLRRVLGDVDAMLIAGCCNVEDYVPVQLGLSRLGGSHFVAMAVVAWI